ncbi:MAG: hypothetical protein JWP27_2630 [Flaviaesturariibacter sp.]|nr:hypothetical protein [Flaviaesturariibacter sp.]
MKKLIWSVGLVFIFAGGAGAQARTKQKGRTAARSTARGAMVRDTVVALTSTVAYPARGAALPAQPAIADPTIADPTINTFNNRVFMGARLDNERAIIGLPKIRTGIANGHILFYPTSAATSGTTTGSGVVGTGTSIGNGGMNEAGIGVNGKNPYAGPGIYGTRVISDLRPHTALAKPVKE